MNATRPTRQPRLLALAVLCLAGAPRLSNASTLYTASELSKVNSPYLAYLFDASGNVTQTDHDLIRPQAGRYAIAWSPTSKGVLQATLSVDGGRPVELGSSYGGGPRLPDDFLPHNENTNVWAFAVNASGTVVGNYEPYGDGRSTLGTAFVYYGPRSGLQAVPLPPTPHPYYGFVGSAARSINDSGLIVGTVGNTTTDGLPTHAFLSDGRSSWDLNTLLAPGSGVGLTDAIDINAAGQIIARGLDSGGQYHDYLLTPAAAVPEPSTLALLAAGCLLGGGRRLAARRRG